MFTICVIQTYTKSMRLFDGYEFWQMVDTCLEKNKMTNIDLANKTGLVYRTITTQRNRHTIPSGEQIYLMAQALGVSMEYLLTGHGKPPICEEAQAVQNDSDLQALVRSIQRDRSLLSIVAAFIRSYENENIG